MTIQTLVCFALLPSTGAPVAMATSQKPSFVCKFQNLIITRHQLRQHLFLVLLSMENMICCTAHCNRLYTVKRWTRCAPKAKTPVEGWAQQASHDHLRFLTDSRQSSGNYSHYPACTQRQPSIEQFREVHCQQPSKHCQRERAHSWRKECVWERDRWSVIDVTYKFEKF